MFQIEMMDIPVLYSWKDILNFLKFSYKERSTGALTSLCIFHTEKTPSLRFYPKSQRFHCYGCGAEGNKAYFIAEALRPQSMEDFQKILINIGNAILIPGQLEFSFEY